MEQFKSIFKMPSRQTQLWLLILLSAATMIVPYGIQGALSSGKEPAAVSDTIWLLDNIAWAIRAMVEGLVIAYIARTKTTTRLDTILLWAAEGALVALITLTLGPTLYAALNGVAMKTALSSGLQWAWALGLASYMPLMVLGASYAYKVQPTDTEAQVVDSAEITGLQDRVAELETQRDIARADANELVRKMGEARENAQAMQTEITQAQTRITALEAQAKSLQDWQLLNATAKAVWIAQNTNGDRPAAAALADALGCNISTVSRAYKKVDDAKGAQQ